MLKAAKIIKDSGCSKFYNIKMMFKSNEKVMIFKERLKDTILNFFLSFKTKVIFSRHFKNSICIIITSHYIAWVRPLA